MNSLKIIKYFNKKETKETKVKETHFKNTTLSDL